MSKLWVVVCVFAVIVLMLGMCHAQDKTFPVSGKVLMPDGSPAAGALVEARNIGHRTDWMVKGTATTSADGTFTMEVVRGRYYIFAVSGEYVKFDESKPVEAAEELPLPKPIEIRLEKGCKVEGSVVDISNGQPVGGVKILSRNGDHAESSDSGEWSMVVRKGDDVVTAIKDGYWWPIKNFDASGDTTKVKIEIKPGGTIKGRVVDEQGQPVSNCWVGTETSRYFDLHGARADAEGRFTLIGQDPDAKAQLWISADGYENFDDQPVIFPAGKREVEVELKTTKVKVRTITGRVTRQDSSPVEGATVAYGHGTNFWDYVTAKTDKDGKYTLKDARIGAALVLASGNGLAPVCRQVEADKDVVVNFRMKPGHFVEGRLEDEDGNPLADAWVTVSMDADYPEARDKMYDAIGHATTDKDGKFRVENLPDGFVYADFFKEHFNNIENERLKVDRKDYTLVLRKTVPGQICGTVVKDSDGLPVTEFNVRLDFSQKVGQTSGLSPRLCEQGVNFQGEDGKFAIKGLAVNDGFRVIVTAPGYTQGSADPVMVKPESEEAYKETVIRLRPAKPFEGVVTEAGTGNPVEGAMVTVWDTGPISVDVGFAGDLSESDLMSISTRTDASGKFRFEAMPFSCGVIVLEKPGLATTPVAMKSFSKLMQASMEKGATVSGSVADEQGKVPSDVYVDLNLSMTRPQINPDGSFKMTDLPPGEYVILQYEKSKMVRYHAFELKAGETYQIDWAKQGAVVVEGKVLQNGKPAADAKINVNTRKKGMNWAGSAETGADGSYKLSLFKPGTYSFSCMVGEWTDPNNIYIGKTLQLAEGLNQVDFSVPSGSISGKLVDKLTGKPIADTSVRLYIRETYEQNMGRGSLYWMDAEPMWWPRNECKTDKNGVFQAKNLKAGEWMICMSSTDGRSGVFPTAVVKLAEDEAKSGIMAKVSPTGSAKISLIGMKDLPEYTRIDCVDEYGMTYYLEHDGKAFTMEFQDLPVGKYKTTIMSRDYLLTQVLFQVQPNKTTNVSVKLTKGPKIIFKPKGDLVDSNGTMSVAFKITTPDGKPVLKRSGRLQWGEVIGGDGTLDPINIVIKPGTYFLKAAIRADRDSWGDESDLTGYSGIIKVVAGKDTIVEIPWEQ